MKTSKHISFMVLLLLQTLMTIMSAQDRPAVGELIPVTVSDGVIPMLVISDSQLAYGSFDINDTVTGKNYPEIRLGEWDYDGIVAYSTVSEEGMPVTMFFVSDIDQLDGFPLSTSQELTQPIVEHEYVDLGLSVKWATCNIGAEKPEDYGDYYAWGETNTKDYYDWISYKWCKGQYYDLIKYCSLAMYGYDDYTDNRTALELDDDVAHVKWGGNWRIPTAMELDELVKSCDWIPSIQNGIKGFIVRSKVEGYTDCTIFMPAAGYRFLSNQVDAGFYGCYWSSSLGRGYPSEVPCLNFYSGYVSIGYHNQRRIGRSVRPVCPKEEITTDDFEGLEMTTKDDPLGSCDDLVPVDSLSYSEQRLKEKITIEKTPNGDVWRVSRDNYEYLSELTRKTEYKGYDVATTEIKGKEESHTIKHWNKTDSIVEHFNYIKNGEFVRDKVITYTYDSRARLISKKTEHVDADNPVYPQKLNMTFSYDRKGMLKKKMEGAYVGKRIQNDFLSQFACDDTMMTVRTFHVIRYSNKGKKNLLPRKELYSTWTSHFNEQGQLILYEKIFNHNEWEIIRYQYDEQGKTSKEEHYHKGPRDSVERLQAIYEYEYKYYMR